MGRIICFRTSARVLPVRRSASSDAGYADEAAAMSALVQYVSEAEPVVTVSATASQSVGISQTAAATSAAMNRQRKAYRLVRPQQLQSWSRRWRRKAFGQSGRCGCRARKQAVAQSVGIIQSATAKVAIAAQAAQVFQSVRLRTPLLRRHHRRQLEPERRRQPDSNGTGLYRCTGGAELDGRAIGHWRFAGGLAVQPECGHQPGCDGKCVFQRKLHRALAYSSLRIMHPGACDVQRICLNRAGGNSQVAVTGSASQSLSISQDAYTVDTGEPSRQTSGISRHRPGRDLQVKIAASSSSLSVSQGAEAHPVNTASSRTSLSELTGFDRDGAGIGFCCRA